MPTPTVASFLRLQALIAWPGTVGRSSGHADPANLDGNPSLLDNDRRVCRLRQLVGPSRANRADPLPLHPAADVLHAHAVAPPRTALGVFLLEQNPGVGGGRVPRGRHI